MYAVLKKQSLKRVLQKSSNDREWQMCQERWTTQRPVQKLAAKVKTNTYPSTCVNDPLRGLLVFKIEHGSIH